MLTQLKADSSAARLTPGSLNRSGPAPAAASAGAARAAPLVTPAPPPAPASEYDAQRAARGDTPVVEDSGDEDERGAKADAAPSAHAGAGSEAAGPAKGVDAAMFSKAFKVWLLSSLMLQCSLTLHAPATPSCCGICQRKAPQTGPSSMCARAPPESTCAMMGPSGRYALHVNSSIEG